MIGPDTVLRTKERSAHQEASKGGAVPGSSGYLGQVQRPTARVGSVEPVRSGAAQALHHFIARR